MGLISTVCIFSGALLGLKLQARLPKHRALYNAIRCLRAVKPNSFAVIVEDDLTFARLWEGVIIRQILANYVSPTSVVLGYSREKIESRHSLVENAHDWDCTVFVAWHGALAHQAADVLEKNLALGGDALPADNALTCFWKANKICPPDYWNEEKFQQALENCHI